MSAGSSRLSVASQFFMDDDGGEGQSISDRVVDLLQQTHSLPKDSQKISNLKHVQELIIDKDPSLLDNFLDEVLQFQFDESVEVRNFVLSFAECACKKDNRILCTVLPRLHMMLTEENQPAAVLKRVILCTSQLFRVTVKWLTGAKDIGEEMEAGWAALMLMKKKIVTEMLDDDNDGVRTYAIKFAETLVVTLSAKSSDSLVPKRAEQDMTLDQLPDGKPLLNKKKLQHEGTQTLDALLGILVSASISSINLMVCMGALTSIAKQRPDFMPKVIQAFENLHVNLPPTLSKSQVSSVRKTLKIQLFGLLRHQASVDLRRNIGTLLTDLGASEAEIIRNTPRVLERPKRPRNEAEVDQSKRKKQKILDDDEEDEAADKKKDEPGPSKRVTKATVIDLLAAEIEPLLRNHENVANLVLLSMVSLPDTMPATFQATYTPIAAAGTETQVQHLSRMMSNQLAAAGIKPSNYENLEVEEEQEPPEKMEEEEDFTTKGIPVLGGTSRGPGNLIWIVGDSLVQRAKERASERNYLHLGEPNITVRWHGEDGATLHDLPRMVSDQLRWDAPPVLTIVHLGSNNIGQDDAFQCRQAIDTAMQDLRTRMPQTHIAWSNIIPRLFYYGHQSRPTSQKALDGVRKSLNNYARRILAKMTNTIVIKHEFDPTNHSLFDRDGVHLSDTGLDILIDSFKTVARENQGAPSAKEEPKKKAPIVVEPQPTKGVKRPKHFKLREVTHLLSKDDANKLAHGAVKRIIAAEKAVGHGPAAKTRTKILSTLVTQFGGNLSEVLESHLLEDLRSRSDIALAWLYQEYANIQGYMPHTHSQDVTTQRYDSLLCNLLKSLLVRTDQRDGLFNRLVMEAPVITDDALKVIRQFCEDETHFYAGMHALRELILKKPADLEKYVRELLDLTQHERTEVRSQAIQYIKRFYERPDLRSLIEEFATSFLRKLLLNRPPATLVLRLADKEMQVAASKAWTEETAKMCLYLYLALLPINHKLIHELANVYVSATADIKRTVLRVLETPVRGVGMSSPELLLLVETCPKGAETLVTRMMHILTDKTPPSVELVKRVKDLYHKRVSDVRFLIPVLTGLEKKDVISAMPKLIRLNPIVVKEVFHRLLMSHQAESSGGQSPLTPAELLIALHNIDPSKCDMKSIIKATSLCFSEKAIYTGEVLAVVMQQLMEQTPLPTLLLRTIIQSLSMYPKLKGFIMNLLQRLINKQVWKMPKLWEGFVKCCERTTPQSFQVLLQLPPPQLADVFEMSKDMRLKLLAHVQNLSSHQQAHIPKAVMTVLETDPVKEREERERKEAEEKKRKEEEERAAREKEEKERLERERLEKEREEALAAVAEQVRKEEEEKRGAEERERVAAAAAEQAAKSRETQKQTPGKTETEELPEDEDTPTKDEEKEEEKEKTEEATPVKAGRGRGRGRGAKAAQPPPTVGVRRSSRRK